MPTVAGICGQELALYACAGLTDKLPQGMLAKAHLFVAFIQWNTMLELPST